MGFALRLARVNNAKTGHLLASLGVVRPVDIPALHDRPIMNAITQLVKRRRRVRVRREEVFREVRKVREFVALMERTEWGKMTRWQRRSNWCGRPSC